MFVLEYLVDDFTSQTPNRSEKAASTAGLRATRSTNPQTPRPVRDGPVIHGFPGGVRSLKIQVSAIHTVIDVEDDIASSREVLGFGGNELPIFTASHEVSTMNH